MTTLLSLPRITRRSWKVWHRNMTVFVRTWQVNFFPPLVEALLYLFAIGLGIGSYIKEIGGVPYVNFIAPAILAIAVMNSKKLGWSSALKSAGCSATGRSSFV